MMIFFVENIKRMNVYRITVNTLPHIIYITLPTSSRLPRATPYLLFFLAPLAFPLTPYNSSSLPLHAGN